MRVDLDFDLPLLAERPQNDVLLREILGFFLGDLAEAQVLLDQRVVDGDALQLVVAEEVDAAVAGVRHVGLGLAVALDEVSGHAGGAHVLLRGIVLAGLDDPRVAELDGRDQAVFVVVLGAVVLERPGGVGVLAGQVEELFHFADGDAAGHFAGGVPAHSVEDGKETLLGEHEEVVLVVVPFHANVCSRRVADAHEMDPLWRWVTALQ